MFFKSVSADDIRILTSDGIYCWLIPTNPSILRIQSLCVGFPDRDALKNATEFHTTLVYSKVLPPDFKMPQNPDRPIEGVIDRIDTWKDHKGRTTVIARIKSDACHRYNQDFLEQGCQNSFPDYQPHITLCYTEADIKGWLRLTNLYLRREGPVRIQYLPVVFGCPLNME